MYIQMGTPTDFVVSSIDLCLSSSNKLRELSMKPRIKVKERYMREGSNLPLAITKEVCIVHLIEVIPGQHSQIGILCSEESCTDQCLAGLSLYLWWSCAGTGLACCLFREAVILSTWSSGKGTWSQAFLLQTSESSVRNL